MAVEPWQLIHDWVTGVLFILIDSLRTFVFVIRYDHVTLVLSQNETAVLHRSAWRKNPNTSDDVTVATDCSIAETTP